jgi:feruloyl esterase
MDTTSARILPRCAALGIAAVLAGCGGDNGSSTATGEIVDTKGVVAGSCDSLVNLRLADVTITSAAAVTPPFTPPGGGAAITTPFCRLVGVARPSGDSEINFEVWLPPGASWNGKFYSSTGGGSTGAIQYGAMRTGLAAGYAAMSQDRGHISRGDLGVPVSTDGSWALGHPEKIIDWAYRSQHVSTVASKNTVQVFYDRAPRHSYFVGCSAGGHIGNMEAGRFPEDFDGIISGAPAWNWSPLMMGRLWASIPSLTSPANALTADKLAILNRAVVASCDAIDGVTDGLIDDPRRCSFDPATLQCASGDGPDCLTAAQVRTAKTIYAGPRRPNGDPIWYGYPPSSELLWTVNTGPAPGGSSFDFFRYWVYENPAYDSRTFNFDSDVEFVNNKLVSNETLSSVVNAPADLRAFNARGGKLLIWHGWADEQVHTMGSIEYYNKVVAASSKAKADQALRVFLMPGVAHCGGGVGPDSFNALGALEQWVENGVAPNRIIASKIINGAVTRTRPLCPYPQVARYTGSGDIDSAENFVCADPS